MTNRGATGALELGQSVTITKLNVRGEPVFAYAGAVAQALETGVVIHAEWTRPAMGLGYTTFEPGDKFTEWFYTDRWYNIMEVRGSSGGLKGWYCNVTWPAEIAPDSVNYRDLLLDLWVAPDGSALTLDMDELDADSGLTEELRSRALAGLAAAQAHLARRDPPFDALRAGSV